MRTTAFLAAGIAAAVAYVVADIAAALASPGYSYAGQSISELSAIGAPARHLAVKLFTVYAILSLAFGFGVVAAAGKSRALRVAGVALAFIGVLNLMAPFAPMHLRGAPAGLTDTMHIALTAATTALIVVAIVASAVALPGRFRLYGWATLAVLAAAGFASGLEGPKIPAGEPTPWLGITERIVLAAYLLWMATLATVLLRRRAA